MNTKLLYRKIEEINKKYGKILKKIDDIIENINKDKRVLIYCAGEHTEELLKNTKLSEKNIIGIIDKTIKGKILNYNIYDPEKIKELNVDIIIISSKKYQNIIYNYLKMDIKFNKEIIKLYDDDDDTFYNLKNEIYNTIKLNYSARYNFINRSKECENLLIILAGYKEFLYDNVFQRIEKFIDTNIDVCIAVSGKSSYELMQICEKNNWSYLETKDNNVCLAQNLVIENFTKAKYIYKVDEDMFITKDFFSILKQTYLYVEDEKKYDVGFVAPIIPINVYGYRRFLEKTGIMHEYEEKFGKAIYNGYNATFWTDYKQQIWLWEKSHSIDEKAEKFKNDKFDYSICGQIFTIGAILFKRILWEKMGGFSVNLECLANGGVDEKQICTYCIANGKSIIISENSFVGHFSSGTVTDSMKAYYEENKKKFLLKGN